MRKSLTNLLPLLVVLSATSCATTPRQVSAPQAPLFQWDPPAVATPRSVDVTLALVNPSYSEESPWAGFWPFTDFSRNLRHDFEEMLTARGFSFRGPFETYEEMTFPDKDGSDLILSPKLEISVDILNPTHRQKVNWMGPNTFFLEGQAAVGGRVTLAVTESLTNERMWSKSIELNRAVVSWRGQKQYRTPPGGIDPSDPGLYEPLGPILEGYYAEVMKTAWAHLDPEEMKLVKEQAQPLRTKKAY